MTKIRSKMRDIRDVCPDINTAGSDPSGDRSNVKDCIEPEIFGEKPVTPDIVSKQRGTKHLSGQQRTNPHHEYNPIVYDIVHGVRIQPSLTAEEVVHKERVDEAAALLEAKAEAIYKSNKTKPLGRSYAHNINFPSHMQQLDFRFGIESTRGESASTLVHGNPTSTSEDQRRNYILSHGNYDPGEQRDRHYDWSKQSRDKMFGVATKHESNGSKVRESLQWKTEMARARRTILVSKCVDDFRSKTQCELGKVHDPLSDTLNVPDDHVFGVPMVADKYNAADLVRRTYLDGPTQATGAQKDEDDGISVKIGKDAHPSGDHTSKAFGVPTVRRDIKPPSIRRYDPNYDLKLPKIRSIADTQNYGDGSTAAGLLNSPYASAGHAAYFEARRTKDELKGIYKKAGITDHDFEHVWCTICAKTAPEESAPTHSIETFRKQLKMTV